MRVIGFNFTKIAAEKTEEITNASINTNIKFTNIEKDTVDLLKEKEATKISFQYILVYEKEDKKKTSSMGEISFEGKIVLSVDKEESKNIAKSWKKKELPPEMKVPLFNLILRRCTPKAVHLQDQVELPFHIPIPKISHKKD